MVSKLMKWPEGLFGKIRRTYAERGTSGENYNGERGKKRV